MELNNGVMMKNAEDVVRKIRGTFDVKRFICDIKYMGNVIEVTPKRANGNTRIWIRLGYARTGLVVNISSIELSKTYRRKGWFTRMMKDIASLDIVSIIMVGGVCTTPMRNWCEKYGFVDMDGSSDYILTDKKRLICA